MKVALANEMAEIDRQTQVEYLIPAVLLMERAALAVCDYLQQRLGALKAEPIYIFCGKGNNAGDGLALARLLSEQKAVVTVVLLAEWAEYRGLVHENLQRALKYGVRIISWHDFDHKELQTAVWIVDALLGTGSKGAPRAEYANAILAINEAQKKVLAIDLPSGIDPDTGAVLEVAVKAETTVTFGIAKPGLLIYPGANYAGKVVIKSIGFPESLLNHSKLRINWLLSQEIKSFLPVRPVNAHKGTAGHLLVIGGSPGMAGAPILTSLSALRAGAGVVTFGYPKDLELAQKPLEIITKKWTEIPWQEQNYRAVVVGPGLGTKAEAQEILEKVCEYCAKVPVVFDADALNLLAKNPELWSNLPEQTVLTPHPGEFARLTGGKISELEKNRLAVAREYASKWGVTLVLKGARTIIASAAGEIYINPTGNQGMATAGMGDLLAGIIGSLLAQGVAAIKAAVAGVYLHGLVGDLVATELGNIGMIASDLLPKIPLVINNLKIEEDIVNEQISAVNPSSLGRD